MFKRALSVEIAMSKKGSKVAKVRPSRFSNRPDRFRTFSIETNGNLPLCHKLELGTIFEAHFMVDYWKEIKEYLNNHGTKAQKVALGCENV